MHYLCFYLLDLGWIINEVRGAVGFLLTAVSDERNLLSNVRAKSPPGGGGVQPILDEEKD